MGYKILKGLWVTVIKKRTKVYDDRVKYYGEGDDLLELEIHP